MESENTNKERQDVTCSEGEAVTELSPSSGSPKMARLLNKTDGDESFYNASIDFYNYLCDMLDKKTTPNPDEFKKKSEDWVQRLRRDWTVFN